MTDAGKDWPDTAGRLIPGGHVLPVRIYFEDTDFSGFVYHANYLKFMERGRSDQMRLMGINHAELEAAEGASFAVHTIAVEYHRPARIDDLVLVETRTVEITAARVKLRQTVSRDGTRLVSADVTVVFVDGAGRAKRVPAVIREKMGVA